MPSNSFHFFHFIQLIILLIQFLFRSTEAPTTFSVARKIIEKDGFGLRGLNKGLTATIGRNGVFNMIYFGFYHSVKDHFPAYEVCHNRGFYNKKPVFSHIYKL